MESLHPSEQRRIEEGKLLVGILRVNGKDTRQAYVTAPGLAVDVLLPHRRDRGAARHGDVVAVRVLNSSRWESMAEDEEVPGSEAVEAVGMPGSEPGPSADSSISGSERASDYDTDSESRGSDDYRSADDQSTGSAAAAALEAELISPLSKLALAPRAASLVGENSPAMLSRRLWQPKHAVPAVPEDAMNGTLLAVHANPADAQAADESEADTMHYLRRLGFPADIISSAASAAVRRGARAYRVPVPDNQRYTRSLAKRNAEALSLQARPTGYVAAVLQHRASLDIIGRLELEKNCPTPIPAKRGALLIPADPRDPRVSISHDLLPQKFIAHPKSFQHYLVSASLGSAVLPRHGQASAVALTVLGEAGKDVNAGVETAAVLAARSIDGRSDPWPAEVLEELEAFVPGPSGTWEIPADELARRADLRSERIVSIDPTTAKDLDDAVSIRCVEDGLFEVGVHIADVSYFIPAGSCLDRVAAERATSTYLVQGVLPMLPPILCEQLCSLNPGVDRLAFSVKFHIRADGTLPEHSKPWFGKTVIRSCAKLDYATAQRMVEGQLREADFDASAPRSEQSLHGLALDAWEEARRPQAPHTEAAVIADVLQLQRIAAARRQKRFLAGAVTLNRSKLVVVRDEAGEPVSLFPYPIKDSNQLIEEYMLLANTLVAQHLGEHLPQRGVLRRHPQPLAKRAADLVESLHEEGMPWFEWSSSGALQRSLQQLRDGSPAVLQQAAAATRRAEQQLASGATLPELPTPELTQQLLVAAVEFSVMGPMRPAEYFVTSGLPPSLWAHYALAVPAYTHFTSPIRRYADVMVHRQLQAVLTGQTRGLLPPQEYAAQCAICNDRKEAAKFAQQDIDHIFLCRYLQRQPLDCTGVAVGVGGRNYFDLVIPSLGLQERIDVAPQGAVGSFGHGMLTMKPRKPELGTGVSAGGGSPSIARVRFGTPLRVRLYSELRDVRWCIKAVLHVALGWEGSAAKGLRAQHGAAALAPHGATRIESLAGPA